MRHLVTAVVMLGTACGSNIPTAPTTSGTPPVAPSAFTVKGVVYDSVSRPVAGATVRVLNGPRAGATAVSDDEGRFEFTETFTTAFDAQASKPGYRDHARPYSPEDGRADRELWFKLPSATPPADISGTYLLTFTAADTCTSLPDEARSRTYSAWISGASSERVTLSGATFAPSTSSYSWNVLYVSRFDEFLNVYFSDPPISERLPSHSTVVINANAEGMITGATIRLRADGSFRFCSTSYGTGDYECAGEAISCYSSNHTLTLIRR